jgi:hypothetical protein
VWFGWRAKRLGATSAFCPQAFVHHAVFHRRAWDHVLERRRRRHFPELVAKMPELRSAFLTGGLFLDDRTAAFDAAVVSTLTALATRRPWLGVAAVPYAARVIRRARRFPGSALKVALVDLSADLVGAWSLARGSLSARCPVL